MDYNLLQQHTVNIYQLRNHDCEIRRVEARSLLKPQRFDLFAKLYYIKNFSTRNEEALRVYSEHIKAFNPDEREPGRNDKNGIQNFVSVFDSLINLFKNADFDERISIVPVDKNGVILDGAHRVAALAYYNKTVTIAQYNDVVAKCDFDYSYFKNRGLAWDVADIIALEMTKWVEPLLVACVWPSTTPKQKSFVLDRLDNSHSIAYRKDIRCDLHSLVNFVRYIYRAQDWTQNHDYVLDKASRVYGKSSLSIVFFMCETSLESILQEKDEIRQLLGTGKDSLHIADNHEETLDIAAVTLDKGRLDQWMANQTLSIVNQMYTRVNENWLIFKKIHWISFKVRVYNLIKRFKS